MPEPTSYPPNPRDAKRRVPVAHWSFVPLTVAMIAVSVLVAVLTRFGEDTRHVHWMFFGEDPVRENYVDSLRMVELLQQMAETRRADAALVQEFKALEQGIRTRSERGALAQIRSGQAWRVVTPIFLHFGPLHILFNMMWLWQLGQVMEERYKTWRFGLLVLFIAVCSNLVQAMARGPNFGGMSGVIYGLFGFALACSKTHPDAPLNLNPQVVQVMLIWLVVCMFGVVGPVANHAHVVGLLSGGLAGAWVGLRAGGWGAWKRRQQFRQAVRDGQEQTLYRCTVCGRTERDEGGHLEFRVGADGQDYCLDHLPGTTSRNAPPS